MDTRTRTASPAADEDVRHATPPPVQDKISAYYSLVFPHYTFYIQTLSIAIGRRCGPNTASSSSVEQPQVDVDLGALKSVSRLHAKIEYDQEEDRFVLVVLGRNGAWVDGVWTCAGSRAPLGERYVSLLSQGRLARLTRSQVANTNSIPYVPLCLAASASTRGQSISEFAVICAPPTVAIC